MVSLPLFKPHAFRLGLVTLIYDLVMTAYYQYCRMGEKGGINFGGSAWKSIARPIADEVVARAILNKIWLFTHPAKGIKPTPDAPCL